MGLDDPVCLFCDIDLLRLAHLACNGRAWCCFRSDVCQYPVSDDACVKQILAVPRLWSDARRGGMVDLPARQNLPGRSRAGPAMRTRRQMEQADNMVLSRHLADRLYRCIFVIADDGIIRRVFRRLIYKFRQASSANSHSKGLVSRGSIISSTLNCSAVRKGEVTLSSLALISSNRAAGSSATSISAL